MGKKEKPKTEQTIITPATPIEVPAAPPVWRDIPMTDRLKWWISLFAKVDKVRFARSAPGVTFKDDGIYVRCNHRYDLQRFGLTEQGVYRFTEKVEFYIGQDSINLT